MTPSSSCLLHTAVASVSLWAQGIVTELRLVPAIDVLARHHGIPDDVAGATLIAAGSSSPELMCTLVSIFVTHSSLGLGTIVGSEVFNLLIIPAGCVYQAKGGGDELRLDRKSVLRDAGFYGASIALLYLALSDGRDASYDYADDDNDHVEMRIYVQFWKACLLSGWYVLYVAVCVLNVDPSDVARRTMGCFGRASSSSVWGGGGGGLVGGDGKSMGAEDGTGGGNDGGDDDGVGVTEYQLDAGSADSSGRRGGVARDVCDRNGKVNNMRTQYTSCECAKKTYIHPHRFFCSCVSVMFRVFLLRALTATVGLCWRRSSTTPTTMGTRTSVTRRTRTTTMRPIPVVATI